MNILYIINSFLLIMLLVMYSKIQKDKKEKASKIKEPEKIKTIKYKRLNKFLNYINVFFGKEKNLLIVICLIWFLSIVLMFSQLMK